MTGSETSRPPTLGEHLRALEGAHPPLGPALVTVLETLADAGAQLPREIVRAALTGGLGETGGVNAHGDRGRRMDVRANDHLLAALRQSGVATVFVYATGTCAHAFPGGRQFRLMRADARAPAAARTYAVNNADWPRWGPAARALVARLRQARDRILDVVTTHYDQRTPCYIGSAAEVAWAEHCIQDAGM